MKIFIAEDEYISLLGLKSSLESLGHEVVGESDNGLEAVEKVLKLKPDIIIMDINLPYMDGIEAIRRINESYKVPSIILSAYHDKKLIDRANEVGVYGYLIKPASAKDIMVTLETGMNRFKEFQQVSERLTKVEQKYEDRKFIEKAKGILMESKGLKEDEAMKLLQKMSRNRNIKIGVLARMIIDTKDIFI